MLHGMALILIWLLYQAYAPFLWDAESSTADDPTSLLWQGCYIVSSEYVSHYYLPEGVIQLKVGPFRWLC